MIFRVLTPAAPLSFVIDASVAAAWAIPLRGNVYTHRVELRLATGSACAVATNWPLDVAEELRAAVGRGETTQPRVDAQLARLSLYRIYLDPETPHRAWPDILDLARAHNITVREAAHLELALQLNLPLATTDATLLRVATAAGVSIFTP
jgi:predicted nucleic acid-binding protein